MPENRIVAATRNAREQTNAEWARTVGGSREEAAEAVNLIRQLRADPQGFVRQLLSEMGQDDGGGQEELDLTDPQPDLWSEDRTQQAYSAGAVQQMLQNLEARIMQRLAGTTEFVEESRYANQQRQIQEQSQSIASAALGRAQKAPHFMENKELIAQKLEAMDPRYRRSIGSVAAMWEAYNEVMAERVFPTQRQTIEQEVIANFQKKVNGGGNGAVHSTVTPDGRPQIRDGNVDDLATHMARIASQRATQA